MSYKGLGLSCLLALLKARNAEFDLKCALYNGNSLHNKDTSDDEGAMSPASALPSAMSKLSPASAKNLFRALPAFSKRLREEEGKEKEGKHAAKRLHREVPLRPGMSLPTAFHCCLQELYNNNIYLLLSLFMTSSLEGINASVGTLATIKTCAWGHCSAWQYESWSAASRLCYLAV
ncbi:hypothetical protein B0H16DRAFT_1448479 [Mycena metata]|uniref:Uncharacterized protein n=1 Tax=Mycena metata TaxID=1033252 RepID=A0AAD7K8C2_9AGAR|nr:hypothetical protein B0H16DRAFT_1448479 [Mycena metata]